MQIRSRRSVETKTLLHTKSPQTPPLHSTHPENLSKVQCLSVSKSLSSGMFSSKWLKTKKQSSKSVYKTVTLCSLFRKLTGQMSSRQCKWRKARVILLWRRLRGLYQTATAERWTINRITCISRIPIMWNSCIFSHSHRKKSTQSKSRDIRIKRQKRSSMFSRMLDPFRGSPTASSQSTSLIWLPSSITITVWCRQVSIWINSGHKEHLASLYQLKYKRCSRILFKNRIHPSETYDDYNIYFKTY